MEPTPAEATQLYEERGYVIVLDVIDEETIGRMNDHFDWLNDTKFPDTRPEKLGEHREHLLADPSG